MFQFAFAHAASQRLGTTFIHSRPAFKESAVGPPLWTMFELGPWCSRATRVRRRIAFETRWPRRPTVVVGQQDEPEAALKHLRDGTVYQGFFQSERWFAGFENEVRELFTPRVEHRRVFERYRRTTPYVCVHVRRGDYLDTRIWALPTSFFYDAIATIDDVERYDIVVVTDDPPRVRREFDRLPRVVCESRPPMSDLQLLAHADIVVTSNSSFSWWGAWLNRGGNISVIAPRYWVGFAAAIEEPVGVIPDRWKTLLVRDPPLLASPADGADRRGKRP